jgi:chromate reductase, NAD(P)H dehydrogenase (quinone)
MERNVRILGIAGSLRKGSYNRAALRAAKQLAPDNAAIEIFELDGIPPFNQDIESPPPGAVAKLKEKIRSSDAILFVTPEYNYSVPGVLKNAIDWASRFSRDDRHCAGAIPPAADVCVPEHVCPQQA